MSGMKRLVVVALLALCWGCAPGLQHREPASTRPTFDAIKSGFAAYKQWQQQDDWQALERAQRSFARALEQRPDNLRLQLAYYQTLYALAERDWGRWHRTLQQHFDAVNRVARYDLSPPAYLQHSLLPDDASLQRRRQLLQRAVAQQPRAEQAWYVLSAVFMGEDTPQLALHAARIASELKPEVAAFAYQLGDVYDRLSYTTRDCTYPPDSLTRNAIRHLSRAVSLAPDDAAYHDHLAMLYSRVGLYPLALQEARTAYRLEASDWNRDTLARALLDVGQSQAALAHYQALVDTDFASEAVEGLALIHGARGQWQRAQTLYTRSFGEREPDIYQYLIRQWQRALGGQPLAPRADWQVETRNSWEADILRYVVSGGDFDLVARADNRCQLTEAHFYTAMRDWLEDGDAGSHRRHLQQVMDLGVHNYGEFFWARAILESPAVD